MISYGSVDVHVIFPSREILSCQWIHVQLTAQKVNVVVISHSLRTQVALRQ